MPYVQHSNLTYAIFFDSSTAIGMDSVLASTVLLVFDTTTPKDKTTALSCEWIALFFYSPTSLQLFWTIKQLFRAVCGVCSALNVVALFLTTEKLGATIFFRCA